MHIQSSSPLALLPVVMQIRSLSAAQLEGVLVHVFDNRSRVCG